MKQIKIGIIGLITILIVAVIFLGIKVKRVLNNYSISVENNKAYQLEITEIKNQARLFKLTTEQLQYMNDSISQKLDSIVKVLKIKDKDLKSLQYQLSIAKKVDTLVFRDTIFQPKVNIDTIIGDQWYNLELKLKYPNNIIAAPTFRSEKYIVANYKKETIKPPNKCFLVRWFQRRHKVVEVNIVEENPYIENKQSRFIEIIE